MQQTQQTNDSSQRAAKSQQDHLIDLLTPLVAPLGYDIVYVETVISRQKALRIFIDFATPRDRGVGIQDCVEVTKALDEPLDLVPEIEAIFKGPYELEVSSPGVDRPLRTENDFARFKGKEVRIHVYRPLTAEELENAPYQVKNPKQKNFLGHLDGIDRGKVLLTLAVDKPQGTGKKAKAKTKEGAFQAPVVRIPFVLISKANIEPNFEFSED